MLLLPGSGLWIRERYPDFINLTRFKKLLDKVDVRSKKGSVGQSQRKRCLRATSNSVSFNIDTNKVGVRIRLCQTNGVLAFPTSQFQYNGIFIPELIQSPATFNRFIFRFAHFDYIGTFLIL